MPGPSIGSVSAFNPDEEAIDAYLMRLKHFLLANKIKDDQKVSVLITVIGPRILAILSDLLSPAEVDSKSYDELVEVLKTHFQPKRLVVAERYTFYSRGQKPGESISEFVVAIKHLASSCKFGTFLKDALRDKLVSGISNENIRQKLLSEEKEFEETYSLAIRLEQAEKQSNFLGTSQGEIAKFNVEGSRQASSYRASGNFRPRSGVSNRPGGGSCWRCGATEHKAPSCPYSSYKCHGCKQQGHLFKMCNKSNNQPKRKEASFKVNQMEEEAELCATKVDEVCLYKVGLGSEDPGFQVSLVINEVPVTMELDTGCAVSICPADTFYKYFSNVALKPVAMKLRTYSGHNVRVLGQAFVEVIYNQQSFQLPLVVVELEAVNQPMLFGRNWLRLVKLDWHNIFACKVTRPSAKCDESELSSNLVKVNLPVDQNLENEVVKLKNRYKSVFQPGTGEIKGIKARIVLKQGSVPKFCKARPVPFAIRDKVELELDRWMKEGIAYKVTNSEWSTPLVVVPKPNGVRICADFRVSLNPCIECEHYPLPTAQDIFASLADYSVFSCIDLSNAYQQLVVAEESQPLLTLSTHRGLIRLRRLPFGMSSSPAIFQAAIDEILQGIPGAVAYLDDVLIGASSREQGLQRLEMVLQRLAEYGVKVNGTKCKFLQSSIEYLGHVISAEGLRPQESNLAALREAPEPTNKDELRAYIGLINYYHAFIPNLSGKLGPFYELLRKDVKWNWSKECSNVFKESKAWVLNSSLLVHYDVRKPIVLTCDASPRGVAAVLSHLIEGQERPIAFASKTLSSSERNYAQLHKEALALVFGVKKFHKFIYGRQNVILQTDHQPLAAIFGSKKGVPSMAAARLQRWALILSAYNLEVRYRRGADVPHADALSRLPLPFAEPVELEANYISHVEQCVEVMNVYYSVSENSTITSSDVARCTENDVVLAKVKDFVMYGWKEVTEPELAVFFRKRDELSIDKNCVLWGSRVVIPNKLRPMVLQMLHEQHPGVSRMKMLARSYVWWPGLDQSIEDTVATCQVCQMTRNAAPRLPLQQWPMCTHRWERLHVDYAEEPNSGDQLLIVVDMYSKWLEVFIMKSTTSAKTIEKLRTLFAAFGLPKELVSDNGTCFTSFEFREFMRKNGIKFTLTPPYHKESNGAAERYVQEVKKNLVRQVLEEHLNSQMLSLQHKLDNFLFAYRNTPTTSTDMTPAELFLNWKPRTKLSLLKPNIQATIEKKREKQKESSDKLRGTSRSFCEGQNVFVKTVRNEKISWVQGTILAQKSPVTYLVSILGKTRFCHADHLRARADICPDDEEDIPLYQELPTKEYTTVPTVDQRIRSSPRTDSALPNPEPLPTVTSRSMSNYPTSLREKIPYAPIRRSKRTVQKPFKLNL